MTLPPLDDDALDQLVRDARPVASDDFEARVFAAAGAGSRRRAVASAAAVLVLAAAAVVAIVVRRSPEPTPHAAGRSPEAAASPAVGPTVSGLAEGSAASRPPPATVTWDDPGRLLAQALAPDRATLEACFKTHASRTVKVRVYMPPDGAPASAFPGPRASVLGHRPLTDEEACVDRILSRTAPPALPSSIRAVAVELVLAPDAPPAPSPWSSEMAYADERGPAMRVWSDPARYVAGLLASSFTPKPSRPPSTALRCLASRGAAEPRLGPPHDDQDITVVVRGRKLHYVASSQPRVFDHCLEVMVAMCRALPLPPGSLEFELRFSVVPGGAGGSREPRGNRDHSVNPF
jgi:hypothetical protein